MTQVTYTDEISTESGTEHIGVVEFKNNETVVATIYSIGDGEN